MTSRTEQRAKYLYDRNLPEHWGSTAHESGDDDVDNLNDDEELAQWYMLETGRLTDSEVGRLDGKTSNRLGVQGWEGALDPTGKVLSETRDECQYRTQGQACQRGVPSTAATSGTALEPAGIRILSKVSTTTTFREQA